MRAVSGRVGTDSTIPAEEVNAILAFVTDMDPSGHASPTVNTSEMEVEEETTRHMAGNESATNADTVEWMYIYTTSYRVNDHDRYAVVTVDENETTIVDFETPELAEQEYEEQVRSTNEDLKDAPELSGPVWEHTDVDL